MFLRVSILFSIFSGYCYLVLATFDGKELDKATQARIQNILLANRNLEFYGSYGNKVYFNSSDQFTHEAAWLYCINNNMKLVSIKDTEEMDYIRSRNIPARGMWTSATSPYSYYWGNGIGEIADIPVHEDAKVCCAIDNSVGLHALSCAIPYFLLCELVSP